MEMTLRVEIFPDDLDAIVDFYTNVLRFRVTKDQRDQPDAYAYLERGSVRIGAARRAVGDVSAARLPPVGAELVLEVDDIADERDRVVAAGWPLDADLQDRPWGLTDFRVLDPAGYYLRITNRAGLWWRCDRHRRHRRAHPHHVRHHHGGRGQRRDR
jgi:catechol 2,3-dioxygenase-like lactoylglutathione lyase family enzyme